MVDVVVAAMKARTSGATVMARDVGMAGRTSPSRVVQRERAT
jgi:hypothetical protein